MKKSQNAQDDLPEKWARFATEDAACYGGSRLNAPPGGSARV